MDDGGSWDSWFQNVAGSVVDKWSSATYTQPYEIQKMRITALGEQGYYSEGLPTSRTNGGLGISSGTLLLAGAALMVVLMLKD